MRTLVFPTDVVVGTVSWQGPGSVIGEAVLATGPVVVPDRVDVTLKISWMGSVRPGEIPSVPPTVEYGQANEVADFGRDVIDSGQIMKLEPLDLGFLRDLPGDSITTLQLEFSVVRESFGAIVHLAAGLKWLYLGWAELNDAALESIAQLHGLVYLQTWGNEFTDLGVQQLAALQSLEALYLEEKSLSGAAFEFASRLPHLRRLGLKDVPISTRDLSRLKARLPGVDVG